VRANILNRRKSIIIYEYLPMRLLKFSFEDLLIIFQLILAKMKFRISLSIEYYENLHSFKLNKATNARN